MSQRYGYGYYTEEEEKKDKKRKEGPTGWGLVDKAAKAMKGRKKSLDEKIKASGG